jgi:heat shock protein HslJ
MRRPRTDLRSARGTAFAAALAWSAASCAPAREEPEPARAPFTAVTQSAGPDSSAGHARLPAPASYFRDVGAGLPEQTLTLRADGIFLTRLRSIESGLEKREHDWGRWKISDDGGRLMLYGSGDEPAQFAIEGPEVLLPLGAGGRATAESEAGRLRRAGLYDPIRDVLLLTGEVVYAPDAAVFTECLTQHPFPVAMELDYPSLEAAYLEDRESPGARLLVSLEGHLEERPHPEGTATTEVLIVDRFERTLPGQRCAPPRRYDASLRDTYWRLAAAYGRSITAVKGAPEPHMVLSSEVTRVHGHLGCNRFSATYSHGGSSLSFRAVAATRMACPDAMETEAAFARVLEETNSYRIEGETLYLHADDDDIARFVAVRLP